jgi:hypothetical protein
MESCDEQLLSDARFACQAIVMQLHAAQTQINGLVKRIIQAHRVTRIANVSTLFQASA